jgi:hypothetical protein
MNNNKLGFKRRRVYSFIALALVSLFAACTNNAFEVKIKDEVKVDLLRFEDDLMNLSFSTLKEKLPALSEKYQKFVPVNYKDTLYQMSLMREVTFPLNQKLFEDKLTYAPKHDDMEKDINRILSHYKYYYPESKISEAFTFISGLSRSFDPVMYDSNSVVIAVDHYYGKDYPVYEQSGVFDYQRQLMAAEFLKVDLARYLALSRFAPLKSDANFLETLIYMGRINYFVESMNPGISEETKMRFNTEELSYCKQNEERVWTYLVEKEILYSNDAMLIKKYTEPRPFANSMEKESPGRIGVWFGRQIVDEYVKNEKGSLVDLMNEKDLLKIFRKAKYRP